MKCLNCGSEWISRSAVEKCPFCGAVPARGAQEECVTACPVCGCAMLKGEVCLNCGHDDSANLEHYGSLSASSGKGASLHAQRVRYSSMVQKRGESKTKSSPAPMLAMLLVLCLIVGSGGWMYVQGFLSIDFSKQTGSTTETVAIALPQDLVNDNSARQTAGLIKGSDSNTPAPAEVTSSISVLNPKTIAQGTDFVLWLNTDGTVGSSGNGANNKRNVDSWTNIVSLAAGTNHSVGLKSNGTVAAVGSNKDGQMNVSAWKNIVGIAAGDVHTVGLCADGTVVATGSNANGQCNVGSWRNIIAVDAVGTVTVGLRSDGTVVCTSGEFSGLYGWNDIRSISLGENVCVGLKNDGSIVTASNGNCFFSKINWPNVVAVSAGKQHIMGLMRDGSVSIRYDSIHQDTYGCSKTTDEWHDIVAISAGSERSLALRTDGTILAIGTTGTLTKMQQK